MQIQKISNLQTIAFRKKLVQPDSFINAPRRKQKNHEEMLISVATRITKERSDKINRYIFDCKKEVKDIQKTAKAHKKQCIAILKKAQKFGYTGTIDCDEYNITFGTIDSKTNKPSSINIWEDGKLAQEYKINSLEPFNIEVYDCEVKNFTEEFYITDKGLAAYTSNHKDTDKMKLIIPSSYGFYLVEGEWNYHTHSIKKQSEIEYSTDKTYPSIYSKYEDGKQEHYQYDPKTKLWKRIYNKKSDKLTLSF